MNNEQRIVYDLLDSLDGTGDEKEFIESIIIRLLEANVIVDYSDKQFKSPEELERELYDE